MNNDKRQYESTFIVNASLEDPQIESVITHVSEIITRNGGEITATNRWGRKRLAYTIKKKNNGFYVNLEFTAPTGVIPQLERMYQLDENILRFLTIQLDDKAIKARLHTPIPPVQDNTSLPEEIIHEPLFEDEEEIPVIPDNK
ncbi:MAG: 30S ribosomal protein S6 [Ignavibacteriales bacterium]|nr:30S ribosomal protein S6 [Ignavibacteriales bacterium]